MAHSSLLFKTRQCNIILLLRTIRFAISSIDSNELEVRRIQFWHYNISPQSCMQTHGSFQRQTPPASVLSLGEWSILFFRSRWKMKVKFLWHSSRHMSKSVAVRHRLCQPSNTSHPVHDLDMWLMWIQTLVKGTEVQPIPSSTRASSNCQRKPLSKMERTREASLKAFSLWCGCILSSPVSDVELEVEWKRLKESSKASFSLYWYSTHESRQW